MGSIGYFLQFGNWNFQSNKTLCLLEDNILLLPCFPVWNRHTEKHGSKIGSKYTQKFKYIQKKVYTPPDFPGRKSRGFLLAIPPIGRGQALGKFNQKPGGEVRTPASREVYRSIYLMTLAGTPPTIAYAGTSLVTTDPAPMIALSPIVTPERSVAFAPTHTFFPNTIGLG